MNSAQTLKMTPIRLPTLAAITLFLLGIGAARTVDTDPVQFAMPDAPQHAQASPSTLANLNAGAFKGNDDITILSPKDASLYRAAFAAQEKADWKAADDALANLQDKRLLGHVLADRYLRRGMTLAEARDWLAAYGNLAEAPAIYRQAGNLRGAKAAHLARPSAAAAWSGESAGGTSFNFRSPAELSATPQKARLAAKIAAALRHGDPTAARVLLENDIKRNAITVADAGDIVSRIAASFFYAGEIDRALPLAHMGASTGAPLGLWIDGLCAWKQKDYTTAARSFGSLAQAPGLSNWDHAAAAFWGYRAAKRIGDEAQARHWLAEAAKNPRSFYGYMAATVGGHRPDRSWKMPELTARGTDLLARTAAGWQALALVQIGQNDLAENELRHINPAGQRELQNAALALAETAHMPSLTLQLSGLATNDNGLLYEAAAYPLPPWQPQNGFKVDRALIYALMKRESRFDPLAVSQSGACGLMQIMPATAQLISGNAADARTARGDCPGRLFDPATNMELGQKYVRVLAGQPMIGDNLLLLLAAYNGGPGNLAHWLDGMRLDGEDRKDPLLFLESMPMRETRDYVQQVLMHYWMYRSRLSEPENSVAQLARGEWPRYALNDNGLPVMRQAQAGDLKLASAGN